MAEQKDELDETEKTIDEEIKELMKGEPPEDGVFLPGTDEGEPLDAEEKPEDVGGCEDEEES